MSIYGVSLITVCGRGINTTGYYFFCKFTTIFAGPSTRRDRFLSVVYLKHSM